MFWEGKNEREILVYVVNDRVVAATRQIGMKVSADKTKYIVMSRDQNAERNHSVRIDRTFEIVEVFK